ncbi:MAG: PIN domain-containing protein [Candidatus Roizmanbacteria bacterium]|nr:PIN domain-containing protein [Candidatus Roizmanbacteria bacterium]
MNSSVFIDSNVWFSAFYKEGVCSRLLKNIQSLGWQVFVSELVMEEVIKNIQLKIPKTLSFFINYLKENNIVVLKNPSATHLLQYRDLAEKHDLPILISAIDYKCAYFITGNLRDFRVDKINNKFGMRLIMPSDFLKLLNKEPK